MQRNEMAEYVNMKAARDVDIMEFWKENRALLPQLFKLVCRVFFVCQPRRPLASVSSAPLAACLRSGGRTSAPVTVSAQQLAE